MNYEDVNKLYYELHEDYLALTDKYREKGLNPTIFISGLLHCCYATAYDCAPDIETADLFMKDLVETIKNAPKE